MTEFKLNYVGYTPGDETIAPVIEALERRLEDALYPQERVCVTPTLAGCVRMLAAAAERKRKQAG